MNQDRGNGGIVLVTVVLVSAVVWVLFAGLLVAVRLHYDVSVAALDNARARTVALHAARYADAHDWWSHDFRDGTLPSGTSGACTWDVRRVGQTPQVTQYTVSASYGRAQVTIEGTARR